MSIQPNIIKPNDTLEIAVFGPFDQSQLADFRKAYEEHGAIFSTYIVDFKESDYIDSLALGELLYFKKFVNQSGARIVLLNVNKTIKDILNVSACAALFEFSL